MRVAAISIKNFRNLVDLTLTPGDSLLLIGDNGAGKSSVLKAVALALGRDRTLSPRDFGDARAPIEIEVKLVDLDADVRAAFADDLDTAPGSSATLSLGAKAVIDGGDVDLRVGKPGFWRASRKSLEALPVLYIAANRNAERLLQLSNARGLLGSMIATVDLEAELFTAGSAVHSATSDLAAASSLRGLLTRISGHARLVLDDAPEDILALEGLGADDLLRLLELQIHYRTLPGPLQAQPSGLSQLAIFAVILERLTQRAYVLLVDEPELSLHPQASRALTGRLLASGAQTFAATHSPDVVTRWELQAVARLHPEPETTRAHTLKSLRASELASLRRYATSGLAEAFFAGCVILVEGPGDRLALGILADTMDADLDARGVSIVELAGADLFRAMRRALGEDGLGLRVLGLCDADREAKWARVVAGESWDGQRESLQSAGVYVLDPDIEAELLEAIGEPEVEGLLNREGYGADLARFRSQPDKQILAPSDALLAYLRHSPNKTVLPPLMASTVRREDIPTSIYRLIDATR